MQHDLGRVRGAVALVSLAPVVADGVGKDRSRLVECCRRDAATNVWIPLKPMLCIFVPEVESPITTGGAECAMLGVKRDVVDCVDIGDVALRGVTMAFEREVETRPVLADSVLL